MKDWLKNGGIQKIIIVVVFVAVLIGSLLLFSFVFKPADNDPNSGMLDWRAKAILAEPANTIDVLILGDSESHCAFSPMCIWEQYGITSYCCGTSMQTLKYSEELLHATFEKHSPKVVILETDRIYKSPILWGWVSSQLIPTFSVLTYHNRWKTMDAKEVGAEPNYTHLCDFKGYTYSSAVVAASASNHMSATSKSQYINLVNRNYIKKMQKFCEEHGAKFVLVSTPSTTNWNMQKHNGVAKLAEQLGIEYIDANLLRDDVPIDWATDSRDGGDHLNDSGAEKVSSYIGKHLVDTGLFVDHRTDDNYAQWNEFLQEFNDMKAEA